MKIIGEIEFADGVKVGFQADSRNAAAWSRWGESARHVTATADLLDAISDALSAGEADAESEVA